MSNKQKDKINKLCETLRIIRITHDYKAKDLAIELDISNSSMSEFEKFTTPSLKVIKLYSILFFIPVSKILEYSESIIEKDSGFTRISKMVKLVESVND